MTIAPNILELAERFRRPSNIARLAACNGAAIMSAAVVAEDGEPESAPEANLGTRIHALVAEAINGWKLAQDTGEHGASWGDTIALACNEAAAAGLDSWSVHCLQATLEFYRDLIGKYGIEVDNVLPEHALDMEATGFRRKGTADLVLVVPFEVVVIVDLKAGFVDQGDAEDHDQMAVYAAAAAQTFKAKKVIVWLWQPREKPANRASAAEFDAATLHDTTTWSLAVLYRSRQPTAELCPGYVQCSTCPALRRCAAAKEFIVNAQEAIAVLGKPIDPEAWGQAIGAAKLAEKWADTWKDAGKAHLQEGGQATGFKLGTGRAIRTVANVPEAVRRLREAGMEAEALEAASLSVTKLPPQAVEVIRDQITEKVSDPPLVADKRGKAA